jgi:hypothetical protein
MAPAPTSAPKRIGARQRSEALLRDVLGDEEYTRLTLRGYLEVRSPSHPERVYRIPRGGGTVEMSERGEPVVALCIGPTEHLPPADVLVMHKLLIEADEETYLQTANPLPLMYGNWRIERGRARLTLTPWLNS